MTINADAVTIVNQIPALAGQLNKALADFISFANAVKFIDDTATGFLEDVKRLVTVIQTVFQETDSKEDEMSSVFEELRLLSEKKETYKLWRPFSAVSVLCSQAVEVLIELFQRMAAGQCAIKDLRSVFEIEQTLYLRALINSHEMTLGTVVAVRRWYVDWIFGNITAH